ncbi:hypothetical protein [Thiolapillus brandeum]|nr:hypothetical protein [Thiolapillus brandeum]
MTISSPRQAASSNHKPSHRSGLFSTLASVLAFLILATANMPTGATDQIDYLSLKMKDDVLKKEMMSGKTMLLPEFEVYDGSGTRIYHSVSLGVCRV